MNNEVKENTLVRRISPTGTNLVARVRWVNEKGEAGVTYIAPDSWQGSAQVVDVDELEVVQEDMGQDLQHVPTKDLIAAVTRLRGMRLPKKPTAHKPSTRRLTVKSKLDKLFDEGGDVLTNLVKKAVQEIREEEGK